MTSYTCTALTMFQANLWYYNSYHLEVDNIINTIQEKSEAQRIQEQVNKYVFGVPTMWQAQRQTQGMSKCLITYFVEDSSRAVSSGFKKQVFWDLPQKRGYGFSSHSSQQRRNGVWVQKKDLLKQKDPCLTT